jgi:hypothetical protein
LDTTPQLQEFHSWLLGARQLATGKIAYVRVSNGSATARVPFLMWSRALRERNSQAQRRRWRSHSAPTASKPCIIAYNDNAEESNDNEGLLCSYLVAIYALLSFFFLSLPPLSSSCYLARRTRPCGQYLLLRGDHTVLYKSSTGSQGLFSRIRRAERAYQRMLLGRDALIAKVGPAPRNVALSVLSPFSAFIFSVAFPCRFPPDKEPWPPYTVSKPVRRLLRQAHTL